MEKLFGGEGGSWQHWAGKEIPPISVSMRSQSDRSPSECAVIRARSRELSRKKGHGQSPTVTPRFVLPAPDGHLMASPAALLLFHSFFGSPFSSLAPSGRKLESSR